jgi:hypothetical protein
MKYAAYGFKRCLDPKGSVYWGRVRSAGGFDVSLITVEIRASLIRYR